MMRIAPVELSHVNQVWPSVEGFIASALSLGEIGEPLYNLHHIQAYVASGEWLLVVAVDDANVIHGAMTIQFSNYPLHRVAFITATGGKAITTPDMFEQLKTIVSYKGATMIQAYGRPSMVRLLKRHNLQARNTLVEATL